MGGDTSGGRDGHGSTGFGYHVNRTPAKAAENEYRITLNATQLGNIVRDFVRAKGKEFPDGEVSVWWPRDYSSSYDEPKTVTIVVKEIK